MMRLEFGKSAVEARFEAYVERLGEVLGHADRLTPFGGYVSGLFLPVARKSVEPMAARLAPANTSAVHQSLLHFVGESPWRDDRVLEAIRDQVLPVLEAAGGIEAWIIDDTSFPKKGRHSVGVARQYCGQLGKTENCQVAVSLSLASARASLPVAWRLYLPEDWAGDAARRRKTGIPDDIGFRTKPEIALEQIREALSMGLPPGVALADASYGNDTRFRDELTALGVVYGLAINASTSVWPASAPPLLAPRPSAGRGRPGRNLRRPAGVSPQSVAVLADGLEAARWHTVTWREGTNASLRSRFARLRVRAAHGDDKRAQPRAEEWLVIEWPEDEARPAHFWLSTLPEDMALERMVQLIKLRWRIERDYRELKQEVGLGHFEGRGWRGFHHHATLCIAAYGFLVGERLLFPPCGDRTEPWIKEPALPEGFRPRGAPDPNRKARAALNPDAAHPHRRRTRQEHVPMSVLQEDHIRAASTNGRLVTQ